MRFKNIHSQPTTVQPYSAPTERRRSFELLGLPESASAQEIRHAYRALANDCHPDKGGDAVAFHQLERAYQECLRRSARRPRISGSPGRDHFRLDFPRMRRKRATTLLCLLLFGGGLLTYFSPEWARRAVALIAPLVVGGLLANLRSGWSLALGAILMLVLGISWWGATAQIGWIQYAFKSDAASQTEPTAAVSPEKMWGLVTAMAVTVLAVVSITLGCLSSFVRDKS